MQAKAAADGQPQAQCSANPLLDSCAGSTTSPPSGTPAHPNGQTPTPASGTASLTGHAGQPSDAESRLQQSTVAADRSAQDGAVPSSGEHLMRGMHSCPLQLPPSKSSQPASVHAYGHLVITLNAWHQPCAVLLMIAPITSYLACASFGSTTRLQGQEDALMW